MIRKKPALGLDPRVEAVFRSHHAQKEQPDGPDVIPGREVPELKSSIFCSIAGHCPQFLLLARNNN
jgi:hypothetical protein